MPSLPDTQLPEVLAQALAQGGAGIYAADGGERFERL